MQEVPLELVLLGKKEVDMTRLQLRLDEVEKELAALKAEKAREQNNPVGQFMDTHRVGG